MQYYMMHQKFLSDERTMIEIKIRPHIVFTLEATPKSCTTARGAVEFKNSFFDHPYDCSLFCIHEHSHVIFVGIPNIYMYLIYPINQEYAYALVHTRTVTALKSN